jgi:hypothetical protein
MTSAPGRFDLSQKVRLLTRDELTRTPKGVQPDVELTKAAVQLELAALRRDWDVYHSALVGRRVHCQNRRTLEPQVPQSPSAGTAGG